VLAAHDRPVSGPQGGNKLELEISAAICACAGDDARDKSPKTIRIRPPAGQSGPLLTAGQQQSAAALLLERCV